MKIDHGQYVKFGDDHLALRDAGEGTWHLSRITPDGLDIRLSIVANELFTTLDDVIDYVERVIEEEQRERFAVRQAEREAELARRD